MENSNFALIQSMCCLLAVIVTTTAIMLATSIRIVPKDKRLSVSRLGRYIGEKGPGIVLVIPIIDKGTLIDTSNQVEKI